MSIEEAERRYKTIRTAFTRYLAKLEESSGFELDDVGQMDPKCEKLRWFIIASRFRPSTSSFSWASGQVVRALDC